MGGLITISGFPGSGTTTVAGLLAPETGLRVVNAGDVFRRMAAEKGMDIAKFADYLRDHPEIDRQVDERQTEIAREGGVILEGRLAGWMTHRAGIGALRVWLACSLDTRVRRVAGREGIPFEKARERVVRRQDAEIDRYKAFYGFDLCSLQIYDLVVDTGDLKPGDIARRVLDAWEERG
jgi:cytidylate kinase